MKSARTANNTTTTATGIPTSMPVLELRAGSVGCGEGELDKVWDRVAKICVDVTTGMRLVDCKEVVRLKEGDGTDVNVVPKEVEVVEMVLDDIDEPVIAD